MTFYPAGAGTREGGFAGGFPPEDNSRVKGRRKGRSGTGTGTICCCAAASEVPEVSEVPSKEEVAVLAVLKKEFTGLTVSQIARFLRKLYPELPKKQRQKKIHRILDKLEKKGFVKTEKIGNFRFARITLSGVLFLAKNADEVDLNLRLGCPKHPKPLLRLLPQRSHDEWYKIAVRLLTKPVEYFEEIDKELLGLSFSAWLDDVSERVLVFMDEDGEIVEKPYKTRFTHPECVEYLLAKYDDAWKIAEAYDVGVFLTITLPPIFPLKVEQYLLSFILHRLRAWLRRRKEGFSPPSIVSNEPQESLSFHKHVIFFGIDWIMDKKSELTKWLDDKVERFLSDMGRHIKNTINNRLKSRHKKKFENALTSDEVEELNKYGRRLLERYKMYKAFHYGYEGPVNWVTKIYKEGGRWVFKNLPPDLQEQIQGNRRAGTLYDGGNVAVPDYLKKYLVKNLKALKTGFPDDDVKECVKLAWYWLLRIPFFTVSPSLRVPREKKPPPVGLTFIGSYHASWFEYEMASLGLL